MSGNKKDCGALRESSGLGRSCGRGIAMADEGEVRDCGLEGRSRYKLFAVDVDGTLTDGKIYFSSSGEAIKVFDVKDGYGLKNILKKNGIKTSIITGRCSEIVQRRAEELDIDFLYQGVEDKLGCLERLAEIISCSLGDVVYMGDDVNDLPCMEKAGLSCCPADAHEDVKRVAGYVAQRRGGQGAVREVIDMLMGKKIEDEVN